MVGLNGRPLISYPLGAVRAALGSAVVVAKADSELPSLPQVEVWIEPDQPRHPLTGLVHALGLAQGRPVLVCACDLPLVNPELIRQIAAADPGHGAAVVARAGDRIQPLLGCYQPRALAPLAAALGRGPGSVWDAVATLQPRPHDVPDPALLLNVNTPEDLLQASALLPSRLRPEGPARSPDQPNVKS
jgi:molybdopterin-guanine dinucleotide biosynthesis protein A